MLALPLDDGHSTNGRYHFGDLAVAVPTANPGLLADREYLLALKDALEGAQGPTSTGRPPPPSRNGRGSRPAASRPG